MFITALFTMAKLWNQLRCPSPDKWIFLNVEKHNGVLLDHKEKQSYVIFREMNGTGEIITLSKIS
jgi:hypothetical protein